MNYHYSSSLLEDLIKKIDEKEKELKLLQAKDVIDLQCSIKIQQVIAEINELEIQKVYYNNVMQDQLTSSCTGCCHCCKNKQIS